MPHQKFPKPKLYVCRSYMDPGLKSIEMNSDFREIIVNKLDFTKLLIHSAQGTSLRINGEVLILETPDMENRVMLVIPQGGVEVVAPENAIA